MLKLSLIALFAMSMATLAIAASYMPLPPDIAGGAPRPAVTLAQIG
ncbi:MAG: hypothetical protein Q8L54_09220 [Devosia sp.]|nr:hypothetical protein [Devosia sp.]